jgi:hypothetical protein
MGTPKKGQEGRADPPWGEKTSLAKKVGGERGNIGQAKIGSKREKEREQLMEPEETVTALKIRERVRSKKEREEDRSRKDRRVEMVEEAARRKAREGRPKEGQWKRACEISPRGGEGEPRGGGQKGQTREE